MIKFSNKSTSSEYFEEINNIFFGGASINVASSGANK